MCISYGIEWREETEQIKKNQHTLEDHNTINQWSKPNEEIWYTQRYMRANTHTHMHAQRKRREKKLYRASV